MIVIFKKCITCRTSKAIWFLPNDEDGFCDKCVPKGKCSCAGPDEPCCDFLLFESGIEDDDQEYEY